MLHSRQNKEKIKHVHEKCLRLIQNDKLPSYEELLEKYWSVSAHHRYIQSFTIEMLQVKCEIVTDIFTQTTQEYNFKKKSKIVGYLF